MTEVNVNQSSGEGEQQAPPTLRGFNRGLSYVPNLELQGALGEVMNERGRAALARGALKLYSRPYHFSNMFQMERFTGDHIDDLVEPPASAPLARISFSPRSYWEHQVNDGREFYRVFLTPVPEKAQLLGRLATEHYGFFVFNAEMAKINADQSLKPLERAQRIRKIKVIEPDDKRYRRAATSLWFGLPAAGLDAAGAGAGRERLDAALQTRIDQDKPLTATYDGFVDSVVKK